MALFSWSWSDRAMVRFHILMSSFSISCTIMLPLPLALTLMTSGVRGWPEHDVGGGWSSGCRLNFIPLTQPTTWASLLTSQFLVPRRPSRRRFYLHQRLLALFRTPSQSPPAPPSPPLPLSLLCSLRQRSLLVLPLRHVATQAGRGRG